MRVLITGGAGFIGSHVVRHFYHQGHTVAVADRFTYAGKGKNLASMLEVIDLLIGDLATGDLADRCAQWRPDWVVHMAAETHVDRAINNPEAFMWSNVIGTTRLLQSLYQYSQESMPRDPGGLDWIPEQIIVYSTDEVFGSTPQGKRFDEYTPYNPSNAYSASKVGVEAIANAFYMTYNMPIIVVRPCNTYGPGQHPEKVIPKFVRQILNGEPVTVYNDGKGARDWLHVKDHAKAIHHLMEYGQAGESYNLAAGEEHADHEIALMIEDILGHEGLFPTGPPLRENVPGRPGHDRRYWMDSSKLRALGWRPEMPFAQGFREAVLWNAKHQDWWVDDVVEMSRV